MKYIRTITAIILFDFLFVFFLPVLQYFNTECPNTAGCYVVLPQTSYESIGMTLTGWDAHTSGYSYWPPAISLSPNYEFTAYGALLFVALPIFLIGVALIIIETRRILARRPQSDK